MKAARRVGLRRRTGADRIRERWFRRAQTVSPSDLASEKVISVVCISSSIGFLQDSVPLNVLVQGAAHAGFSIFG